jgi:hypothetical protein
MGRKSETGGVSPLNERIQLRFTWRGKEYRPSLTLKPTASNLKAALRMRQQIVEEILTWSRISRNTVSLGW